MPKPAETNEASAIDLTEIDAVLAALPTPAFNEIAYSNYKNKNKRSIQLLSNRSVDGALSSRSEWYSYDLREVTFISSVELTVLNFDDDDRFEFSYTDSFTKVSKNDRKLSGRRKNTVSNWQIHRGFRH